MDGNGTTPQITTDQRISSEPPYKVGYKRPPIEARWVKGQSGNPGGKTCKRIITKALRQIVRENELGGKQLKNGKTVADVLASAIVAQALKGNAPYMRELIDRVEGKVPDRIAGHDGGPLKLYGQAAPADDV